MVKVKSNEEISKRYVRGSMDCFMRGEKNLNWIVGIIRSSGIRKDILKNLFSIYHENYAEKPRFQELEKKIKELDYI